ncbi:MAG: hypothetical protein Q7R51_02690 [bacterium]|nr:hypothetical protein [bacterium]
MMGAIQIVGEFILFLLTVFFYFYIPGNYLLSFSKIDIFSPGKIFLSIISGVILFTLAMYIFSWVHLQWLIFPIVIFISFLAYKKHLFSIPNIPAIHKNPIIFVCVLAFLFSLPMIFNGNFGNSIYYFGDDSAHLAYINELRFAFPPQHPGFAGIPMRGYHFFYDFLLANISKVSFLSPLSLYFHLMPIFVAFGWAIGTYSLLFSWTKKISIALWGVFLVLFGSSFGFILYFLHHPNTSLSTNFGIGQPEGALYNAPYAFSVVIVLATLILMQNYLKNRDKILLFLIAIFVGISPMFKVYAGMILIGGFIIFVIIELLRKNFSVLWACILGATITLGTFGVFAGAGAGLFYLPMWPIYRMMDDVFPIYDYNEKIRTYGQYGVIKGLVSTYLTGFSVLLIGNLGTRFFGIILLPLILLKNKKLPSRFAFVVISMMAISVVVPLFFAQTIKVFDMIQMFWYYPLFVSLFASMGIYALLSLKFPKVIKIFIVIIFIFMTLPLAYDNALKRVVPLITVKRTSFSDNYFQAMNYLKNHGSYQDTVLDLPLGPEYAEWKNIESWFNSSSAHIAIFGNKRMYVGNQLIVFPNMPLEKRLALLESINKVEYIVPQNSRDIKKIIEKIKSEKISYVYAAKKIKSFEGVYGISLVFQNSQAVIYKIN